MGKATRWLRGLLGMKKDKENMDNSSNYGVKKEKKSWGFAKSRKDSEGLRQIPVNIPANNSDWLRSLTEKEQNKHAIAVAAATAAAADAAVAAAQAAVAVVRLTSKGRGALFAGCREKRAAVKIQTVFRGYLARKALRALKGLVKLQALVRGYLVRKRAAATLHSMQALIRAQAAVRSQRARRSMNNNEYRFRPEMRARKSAERFDETRSELLHSKRYEPFDESPKIVEIDTYRPKSRSRRMTISMSEYGDDLYSNRLSIHDCPHIQDFDWGFVTAHNTPRFACSAARANGPSTPAKSVCGDSFFRPCSNCPNYMAKTQSFRAKLRSHSAPKQRPELAPKKRLSLDEIMASRSSFSGVRMQKPPCSHVKEDFEHQHC